MRECVLSAIGAKAYSRPLTVTSAAMKVRTEPKPLHEPLAGGTPGATVAVEPLIAGSVTWPRTMMERPGGRFETLKLARALLSGSPAATVPCPAFLIRHPSAGAILVDTGLHPSIATDGKENFGSLATRFGHPALAAGEDVPAQLRKKGLDPGEIPIVVMTHMHIDHTSAISEFPNSTFVLSEVEWEAAASGPRPLLNGYRRVHFDYAFDYRTVDFDRGGIDSYATFGRTFDLFGDGSLRLAYTPGHSAGHTSVIARLGQRDFVIGGDATYTAAQLDGDAPLAPRPFDAHNYRRSLQELKLFKREFPNAIVTPGHDPEFFAALSGRYE
jgi:glyoxylase-like metal-dependent hydrolase (beta-lactamase superfamily II)